MLSVVGAEATLSLFASQDALFAENAGQWASPDVYYGYNQGGTQIYFTGDSLEFSLSHKELKPEFADVDVALLTPQEERDAYDFLSTHFSLTFDSAMPTLPEGADQATTVFNYHIGEQADWINGVSTYKTIIYDDLYPGVDLHTFSRYGQMKYEFRIAPGADYSQIGLSYAGIQDLSLAEDGSLHITTSLGEIVDDGLYMYQIIDGQEVEVGGDFVLLDNDSYTFEITGAYDPTAELIIDPEIEWGTFVGGTSEDYAHAVATDAEGNVFVCGATRSQDWGISNDLYGASRDGYVVKLNSDGSHLWSTYLGGNAYDAAYGVAAAPDGNVYVCGVTENDDWGTFNGWQTGFEGGQYGDGFVLKISKDGKEQFWGTYLGGTGADWAFGVAADTEGNAIVCGETWKDGWEIDGDWYGGNDGYVAKIDGTNGDHLASTYLGGAGYDYAYAISINPTDEIYVTGRTWSKTWGDPIVINTERKGSSDAYVVKLSDSLEQIWGTHIGGTGNEYGYGVHADAQGNVYVCGQTDSGDWDAVGLREGRDWDGYVCKLSSEGDFVWGNYQGGTGYDYTHGITSDTQGNVYAAGYTRSGNWTTPDALGSDYSGNEDGFLIALSAETGTRTWGTYLGGSNNDYAKGLTVDAWDNVYACGTTYSGDWKLGDSNSWDEDYDGGREGFLAKFVPPHRASISGTVYVDANQNGLYDANEMGIDGVTIELRDASGDNVLGSTLTSDGGFYFFEDLDPGVYQLHEIQPTGVDDGAESLGSLGGEIVANDVMQLTLERIDASDYVFAELGQQVSSGDTATIGFWQNKHGQNLIQQGGAPLADWLTSNFSNVFGNSLVGASGVDVASFYKDQLFKQKSLKNAGPAKVDAQFMAVALSTYFTNGTIAGDVAVDYGFNVTDTGIGTKIVNVGSSGAAFGVGDYTDLTIMQLLWATDSLTDTPELQTGFTSIYDKNGDGIIDAEEAALRVMANEIYTDINEGGDR